MKKDWIGNKKSTFVTLGASSHSEHKRETHDYYATDPKAAELLLNVVPELADIWECACGAGHLSEVFKAAGKLNHSTDLIDRGYGQSGIDFLKQDQIYYGDIVTNPPYKYAKEFVEKALEIAFSGRKVCMFLKITFLEGKSRKELFKKYPPRTIYVSSSRLKCALNGDFDKTGSSAACYAWFVWEKGYFGKTSIEWIN